MNVAIRRFIICGALLGLVATGVAWARTGSLTPTKQFANVHPKIPLPGAKSGWSYPCGWYHHMRTFRSRRSATILLTNSAKSSLLVYTIDARKRRVTQFVLAAGKRKVLRTRVGAAWELRDNKGRCVWLLRPNQKRVYKVVVTPFLMKIAVPIKSIRRVRIRASRRASRYRRTSRYRRLSRSRRASRARRRASRYKRASRGRRR